MVARDSSNQNFEIEERENWNAGKVSNSQRYLSNRGFSDLLLAILIAVVTRSGLTRREREPG